MDAGRSERATISVVIPAYNVESVIAGTLESVLAQTCLPDEVITVDDGSTDDTRRVVERIIRETRNGLMRLVAAPHAGPGAARNCGIRHARGDWIAFLDGDDLWEPTKLEELRRAISESPDATMIAHDNFERADDGSTVHNRLHRHFDPDSPLLPQLYRVNFMATSCTAVRASAIAAAGGFDEGLGAAQDFDLWLRLARTGRLVFVRKPLETYVRRVGSISTRWLLVYRCSLQIAYDHAPYLVPLVGWRRAFLLRFRRVLIAHHYVLRERPWTNPIAYASVLLRAPVELIRAVLAPLRSARSSPLVSAKDTGPV